QSLMADVLESLIAAIYLDGGFEAAADFIRRNFGPVITTSVAGEHCDNFKSMLQQLAQRKYGATPSYQLVDERGPDHDKFFKVVAKFANKEFTPAWGRNKKEAEQKAASNALAQLNNAPPPYVDE
ncbi:MAG TPA: putative dsRNA-binding protein, partial [Pirellulaceae bacterium]|nr:putative dsRNA-binding protein [Pirellulaceae bacterium]